MNPHATKNLKPFKKGQSGNPNGRPKGSRNRSTIVREILDAPATDGLGGTIADQMTRVQAQKAIKKGDTRAYQELMKSAYGDETVKQAPTYTLMPTIKKGGKKLEFNVGEKPKNPHPFEEAE